MTSGEEDHRAPRRRWTRIFSPWFFAIAAGLFLISCSCCVWSVFPSVGIGVSAEEARIPPGLDGELPRGATDVSYYLGGLGPASFIEFTADEAALPDWAQERGWELEEFVEIRGEGWGSRVFRPEPVRTAERPEQQALVVRGYRASWYDAQNPDAGWQFLYDRDSGRAYYSFHTR